MKDALRSTTTIARWTATFTPLAIKYFNLPNMIIDAYNAEAHQFNSMDMYKSFPRIPQMPHFQNGISGFDVFLSIGILAVNLGIEAYKYNRRSIRQNNATPVL